jgi:hypothetical protein
MSALFLFEHGLKHGPPGDPPLLRVTIDDSGQVALEHVDEHDESTQRGETLLLPADLAALRELLDSDKLKALGHSIGHGPSWGRVAYGTGQRSFIWLLHSTPAGVLLPESLNGVAKAALPLLRPLLGLFGLVAKSSDEPTERKALLLQRSEQPIHVTGPHGNLLIRYHESTDSNLWLKLFDSGVVEYRRGAAAESDGKPHGSTVNVGTGRAAELYELVRRHVPRNEGEYAESASFAPALESALWEIYKRNGKRDIRRVLLNPTPTSTKAASPSQRAAVKEALHAFGELFRKVR